jgi:hypothetical protein
MSPRKKPSAPESEPQPVWYRSNTLWSGLMAFLAGCLLLAGDTWGFLPGMGNEGKGAIVAGLTIMGVRGGQLAMNLLPKRGE